MRTVRVVCAVLFVGVTACGSTPPPAAQPQAVSTSPSKGAPQTWSELGVLDSGQVRATFEKLWNGPMQKCLAQAGEMVSGDVTIRMRTTHDGEVRWAHLKESNLGDRQAEKCLLQTLHSAKWPTPEAGDEGISEQQLPFVSRADRPPVDWEPDRVRPAIDAARDKLNACLAGTSGTFIATAIVRTNGKVDSVGIAVPGEEQEQAADCLADVISGLTFPTTGSWPAKVSFELP